MGLFNISSSTTSVYFIIVFIIINNILLTKVLKQYIYDCLYKYICKMRQSVYTSCLLCIIIWMQLSRLQVDLIFKKMVLFSSRSLWIICRYLNYLVMINIVYVYKPERLYNIVFNIQQKYRYLLNECLGSSAFGNFIIHENTM